MKRSIRSKILGFTLIELMIALAVIAIIAAFGFPSYLDYVEKTRRSDGIVYLTSAANFQERQMTRTGSYTTNTTPLGGSQSEKGYYALTVATSNTAVATPSPAGVTAINLSCAQARCFQMAATVQGLQAEDTDCAHFVIDHVGRKSSHNAAGTRNPAGTCW